MLRLQGECFMAGVKYHTIHVENERGGKNQCPFVVGKTFQVIRHPLSAITKLTLVQLKWN